MTPRFMPGSADLEMITAYYSSELVSNVVQVQKYDPLQLIKESLVWSHFLSLQTCSMKK